MAKIPDGTWEFLAEFFGINPLQTDAALTKALKEFHPAFTAADIAQVKVQLSEYDSKALGIMLNGEKFFAWLGEVNYDSACRAIRAIVDRCNGEFLRKALLKK